MDSLYNHNRFLNRQNLELRPILAAFSRCFDTTDYGTALVGSCLLLLSVTRGLAPIVYLPLIFRGFIYLVVENQAYS